MEGGARDYVNHPRGVRVEGGRAWLSSIYRWCDEDFGGSEEFLLAHLKRYAEPGLDAALERVTSIEWLDYDWSLNELPSE